MAVKKRYDICLAKEIPDKNSREGKKTLWKNCGKMIVFDNGNIILDLDMFKDTFNVFPEKPREKQNNNSQEAAPTTNEEGEEITAADIPF